MIFLFNFSAFPFSRPRGENWGPHGTCSCGGYCSSNILTHHSPFSSPRPRMWSRMVHIFEIVKMALSAVNSFVLKRLLKLNWSNMSTVNMTVAGELVRRVCPEL